MKIGDQVYYTNPYDGITELCEIVEFRTNDTGDTKRAHIIGPRTNVITNLTNLTYEMPSLQ
jgi:hypothetical protein